MLIKVKHIHNPEIYAFEYTKESLTQVIETYFHGRGWKSVKVDTETFDVSASSYNGTDTDRSRVVKLGMWIVIDDNTIPHVMSATAFNETYAQTK